MKDSKFAHSLETILLGMLLAIIAFIILGYSDGLFHSKNIVRWLPSIESEEFVRADNQMMKLVGVPEVKSRIEVPKYEKDLIYFKRVHEVKNEKDEWVEVKVDEAWANFTLNGIDVYPYGATTYLNLEEKYVSENVNERQVIYGVDYDEKLIVVGKLINGEIRVDGDVYAISNKDNTALEKELREEINDKWWFFKLISLILLTIGIVAFFIPIIAFLEILPQLGYISILLIISVALATSFIFVVLEILIFAFWYLILLVLFAMVYLFIRVMVKKKKKPMNIIPN